MKNCLKMTKCLFLIGELILVTMAFYITGWIRTLPILGEYFLYVDVNTYRSLGILYAIAITICYALEGSY